MSTIRVVLLRAGRPQADCPVRAPDLSWQGTTDESGAFEVALPAGRTRAEVDLPEQAGLTFTIVRADGMRTLHITLPEPETVIDDPAVIAAMPSDRYLPLRLLGSGASGTVYRCRDARLDRLVAIKLLNPGLTPGATEAEDFLQEARALARVEHPNLIQIYDVGLHQGRPWMVVQLVDGPDLDSLLQTTGALGVTGAAAAGVQLLRALDALHQAGFLHRDVKPSNGLVNQQGVVRLADFGLVRPIVDFADPRSRIFGTPAYMSPEQLQAQPMGPATDLYALGASLFHMASGRLPFEGGNPILDHIMKPAPSVRALLPDAPEAFDRLLQAMMAKSPGERPEAREVLEVLEPLAEDQAAPLTGHPYRPRLASPLTEGRTRRPTGALTGALTSTPGTSAPPPMATTRTGTQAIQPEPSTGRRTLPWVLAAVTLGGIMVTAVALRPPAGRQSVTPPVEVPTPPAAVVDPPPATQPVPAPPAAEVLESTARQAARVGAGVLRQTLLVAQPAAQPAAPAAGPSTGPAPTDGPGAPAAGEPALPARPARAPETAGPVPSPPVDPPPPPAGPPGPAPEPAPAPSPEPEAPSRPGPTPPPEPAAPNDAAPIDAAPVRNSVPPTETAPTPPIPEGEASDAEPNPPARRNRGPRPPVSF
jgi:serine/threonine-protein kinase